MRSLASYKTLITIGSFILALTFAAVAFGQDVTRREIMRTTEKEMVVSLEAEIGTVTVSKGEGDKIVNAEYWRDQDEKQHLGVSYQITDGRGDLRIELTSSKRSNRQDNSWTTKEKHQTHNGDDGNRHLLAEFTDAIPISLKISLGAGKGDFDLTGLKVNNLSLSAGASSTNLRCDEANDILCEEIVIKSGVSKFSAEGLCNLNFRRLEFSGGIGAYKLDFGGKLRQDATADIEVGLGALTVYVPAETPARVIYDGSWFSSIDVDDNFIRVKKSVYETESFKGSNKHLTIKVESGLGSVKFRSR